MVVVADIATAGVPKQNAVPDEMAMIEQRPVESDEAKPSPEIKLTKKKPVKKKARLDFGRFEGY